MVKKLIILFLFSTALFAKTKEVPYTLGDRDRMIRLEIEQKELRIKVNASFDAVNTRIDAMRSRIDNLEKLTYFILAAIITIFAYTVWGTEKRCLNLYINHKKN